MVVLATVLLGACLASASASAASATPADRVRLDVRIASVEGQALAYATLGPRRGVPLLLLNGTGSPMAEWDPALLGALARHRQVVVFDYPGLGQSAALPGRLTFDALAGVVLGLADALHHPRVDVLGWSMGGFVAQRMAVRAPERVRSLVLAGTNPGGPSAVLGPPWVQAEDSDAGAGLDEYVRTNYPPGQRDRGWAFIARVGRATTEGRYPPDRVPARVFDAMVAAEDPWLASGRNPADLATLDLRTLVVTGSRDVVTPPANSVLIASTIPGAELTLVPDAGHSFLFQAPARTARLVDDFLGGR